MLHVLKLHSLYWPPGGDSSGCIEVYASCAEAALSLLTTRGILWLYRSLYSDSTFLLMYSLSKHCFKSSSIQPDVILVFIQLKQPLVSHCKDIYFIFMYIWYILRVDVCPPSLSRCSSPEEAGEHRGDAETRSLRQEDLHGTATSDLLACGGAPASVSGDASLRGFISVFHAADRGRCRGLGLRGEGRPAVPHPGGGARRPGCRGRDEGRLYIYIYIYIYIIIIRHHGKCSWRKRQKCAEFAEVFPFMFNSLWMWQLVARIGTAAYAFKPIFLMYCPFLHAGLLIEGKVII